MSFEAVPFPTIVVEETTNISVLGSTGSVGTNALEVIRAHPDRYRVVGLGAGQNWEMILDQMKEFQPEAVFLSSPEAAEKLRNKIANTRNSSEESRPEVYDGEAGMREVGSLPGADVVLSAVSGAAGLPGTMAAVRAGKRVALANKESMVLAGSEINRLVEENDAEIIPVDSEHSSLFRLLQHCTPDSVDSLILTASGGPFRTWQAEEIQEATPEEALDHPTWDMGDKITIDSATLMNKAFEVIEAKYLFDMPADCIDVLIHPQSLVHAFVKVSDGSLFAHMGPADMKKPIQYAFDYPQEPVSRINSFDPVKNSGLTFEPPRTDLFPALTLGFQVAENGGTAGAVLNAANEVAVDAFLDGQISFPEITEIAAEVLDHHTLTESPTLPEIRSADQWAREQARHLLQENTTNTSETIISEGTK